MPLLTEPTRRDATERGILYAREFMDDERYGCVTLLYCIVP